MDCARVRRVGERSLCRLSILLVPLFVLSFGQLAGETASHPEGAAAPVQAKVLEASGAAELPPPAAARQDAEPLRVTGGQLQAQGPQAAQVTVNADRAIGIPEEHFKLHDPPRVVINIPGALDTWRANIPGPAEGPVKGVRSAQYKERPQPVVRVVVDLRGDFPYRLETAGNQLRVLIGGAIAQAAPAPAPAAAAPTPAPPAARTAAPAGQVKRVDVRALRGRSRISIATSGSVTFNITEVSDPPSLVVDIPDAIIEPRAAKAVELRQATTPVQRVRSAQHQEDSRRSVRVVADLRGPAKYEVAQVGSLIQVDLIAQQATALQAAPPPPAPAGAQPPPGAPAPPAPPSPAAGEAPPPAPPPSPAQPTGAPARISMDFKDADINNLLRIIAEVSGLNVVAGSDVTGKVTVRLINVEWPQALDLILKINNLAYEQDGNVIRVASQAALQRERDARTRAQEQEARAREAQRRAAIQLEPLQFRIIPINYAKAQEVFTALRDLTTKERPGASMVVDARTNSLIINDLPATISRVESLLKTIDRPTPQVLIEARLVEATKSFAQSLGVQWGAGIGAATNKTAFPNTGAIFGSTAVSGPIPVPGIFTGTTAATATNEIGSAAGPVPVFINFPASIQGIAAPAIGLTLGSLRNPAVLGFQLSAAETESKIRTLSAPKVMTVENIEAEIRQGTQVPYTTIDSSGRTVVAFQDAFIRLKVTPKVTNDRRITMKVEAERTFPGDRIDFAGGFAFPLNQRRAQTNVLVNNGATFVIGGLLQTDERYAENRLPFLADIPLLSILFKSKNVGPDIRNELLIFITPTIVEESRVS